MKKILIKISVILLLVAASATASIVRESHSHAYGNTVAYADDIQFQPIITVKPDNLPGQTATEQQRRNPDGSVDPSQTTVKNHFLKNVLPNLAVKVVSFASALALVFLVIAGVRYMVAYGNEDAANNAKTQAIYAIVGLVIAIFSYAIVQLIIGFDFNAT